MTMTWAATPGAGDTTALARKFERCNFHREEDFRRAETLLANREADFARRGGDADFRVEGDGLLWLAADQDGAGRSYFLDALVFRRGAAAALPLRVWHLDLAGFEPDRPRAHAAYLQYQWDKKGRDPARLDRLSAALRVYHWPRNDAAAILLALLAELDDPATALADLPADETPERWLALLLGQLTRASQLIVHLVDPTQLNEILRRELVAIAQALPRCFVAFSCGSEGAERVVPGAPAGLAIEIEPLAQDEVQQALDQSFAPHDFPPTLAASLWRSTGGAPALLGLLTEELIEGEILQQAEGGPWRLAAGGSDEAAVQQAVQGRVRGELEALFAARPASAKALRSLLVLGALCGEAFPPMLLLEMMGLPEEEADDLIDWIDKELVEELGFVDDVEFRHPGFPGLQIYRFAHPALAATLRHLVGADGISAAANNLLDAVRQRLPPWTRAAALLHRALSRQLGRAYQYPHLDRLAFWIAPGEVEALTAVVRARLDQGQLSFAEIWQVLAVEGTRWPPYRRLALLEAAAAELAEAYASGGGAELADAYALLLARQGEHGKARELLEIVLEAHRGSLGDGHPETLNVFERLALTFYAEGHYELARGAQEQILAGRRQVLGENHPESLTALWNLAVTLKQQGELELASGMLSAAAAEMKVVLGERHPIVQAVAEWLEREKTPPAAPG